MAVILQTPSILPITPFDPSSEFSIEFVYDDVQSVKNRAVITENDTGSIVYDSTQSTMRKFHLLPAKTLKAGKKYLVKLQVFDADNNSSNFSDTVLFLCLSTPTFSFKGLTNGEVYRKANITLQLVYSQSNGEQLKNYQFIQYNASKVKLESSDIMYLKDGLSYTFYGLEDSSTYYFRAIGETQNGVAVDTGYIEVNTKLTVESLDTVIQLSNDYFNGVIRMTFDIKDVHYTLTGDNYTFKNGMVTFNNTALTYDGDFSASDDFSLFCQVNQVALGIFLEMGNGLVQLSTIKICDSYYCVLSIKDSDFKQYVKLNNATLTNGQLKLTTNNTYITIVIRRVRGYYALEIM